MLQKMAFNLRPFRLIAARMNDVFCDTRSQPLLRRNVALSRQIAVRLNDIPSPITGARIHQQSNRITISTAIQWFNETALPEEWRPSTRIVVFDFHAKQ